MSQFFASGGQSIGASALASVLPMNIQDWFPLGLTGLISLQSKRFKSLLQHHSSKASILWCSAFFLVQLSHPYMTTGKTIALTRGNFVGKVTSLLLNMLSRLVIAFLPRSKRLLISWLHKIPYAISSVQFSLVAQLCLTLCDPMDFSMPGFPIHHQLPEHAHTHVHQVSNAIQPSHPLLSPSPPAFNLSQNQGFFQWVSSLHHEAKVLEFQLQYQSFQLIFRTDFL